MKQYQQAAFIAWRFYLIVILIIFIVAILLLRTIDLAIFKQNFLRNQGAQRAERIVSSPAFRGIITDRNGFPLAVSTEIYSIWINPKEFEATPANIKKLSKLLDFKPSTVQALLQKNKNKKRQFIYLKRDVPPDIAKKIKVLNFAGVYQQQDYKRFYPEGEVAAQVIGFTNVDDQGQEGLELAYNQWLAGLSGQKVVLKNRFGQTISEVRSMKEEKQGNNLTLSLDRRIQYVAYRELLEGIQKNKAQSGSVVVLDIKTGEVLAMANLPSYNPNNRSLQKDAYRNRAVTDVFEPGSTIKTFSIATALASGRFTPETMIDTRPGWISVGHHVIHDEHRKGLMTVRQILQISSNVGVTKIMLSLPPNNLWELLHKLGFGEETGVGFPGERSGLLVKRTFWPPLAEATLAFGYGISVTALQLAHAYATIGNHGVMIPLTLLKVKEPPVGQKVMDPKIAKQMLNLLESVVEKGGTGEVANIPGYHVAAKTGTTKKLGENGYEKHQHISSFIGIAPATNPRLVVAVIIHEPQGKEYYGGTVAGPVFKKIMETALRIFNLPPDDLEALKSSDAS